MEELNLAISLELKAVSWLKTIGIGRDFSIALGLVRPWRVEIICSAISEIN
ncbi:hypothetical protein H1P_970013 [Hyella patelloides LEGE 07179]|uniref:Uncharacterized protein n=1 Tax=Hyella patelloides LEGE 07179 TaxID=945734 RepID=A0A563W5M1_9CYAN|nr:hypothetical protein H1P_970013 [Hyella patelloides LEGE 07179]